MTASADWVSAIAILASGVILGAMFIYFVRRRSGAAPAEDLVLRDLVAKRDTLVEQLRDPAIDAEERTRLEVETAQVLRQIDEHNRVARKPSSPGKQPVPAEAPRPRNRAALVGFAWGAGSVLLLGGLGYFVMQSAKSREPNMGATGGQNTTMAPAPPSADPAVLQLEAAVQKSPDDLNMRVELAKAYLERDNLMGVFDQTQYVLSKSPNDSRALTYQALVRMAMGQASDAEGMLEKATKSDSSFIDAWVALAWVKTSQGKPKEAEAAISEAQKRHPQEKQRLEQVYAQMKQQAAGQPAAKGAAELPPGHPAIPEAPGGAAPVSGAGAPPAAATPDAIHITLELDPAARTKSGVLFIMARGQGETAGPPLAVKRFGSETFPMTVDLSSADSMMGQPLPAKVRVEVRLDADGDAATRGPDDAHAVADPVTLGSKIKMTLK
ncbi:MAG TPA: tetratricopeptide repeat protein [Thermoanaerobaculia bacterium]|nr:tetratricopeptide repeat protein [Thermoanaerobaculia bacterium]